MTGLAAAHASMLQEENLIGSDGNAVMSYQNFLINGNFDFWQRGSPTVAIPYNTVKYHADRWFSYYLYEGATSTVTKVSSIGLVGSQYSVRIQRNSGSTFLSQHNIYQSLETSNSMPLAGKTVTLSFYARSGSNFSAASSALQSMVATGTGVDQNYKDYTGAVTNIQSNTISTSWQKFSHTVSIPANATEVTAGFYFQPSGTAGANDYFEITQVMFSIGTSAAMFQRAGNTIGGELALCQRYYEKSYELTTVPGTGSVPSAFMLYTVGGNTWRLPITYKMQKFRPGTATLYHSVNANTTGQFGREGSAENYACSVTFLTTHSFLAFCSEAGLPAGNFYLHWTADAEL